MLDSVLTFRHCTLVNGTAKLIVDLSREQCSILTAGYTHAYTAAEIIVRLTVKNLACYQPVCRFLVHRFAVVSMVVSVNV